MLAILLMLREANPVPRCCFFGIPSFPRGADSLLEVLVPLSLCLSSLQMPPGGQLIVIAPLSTLDPVDLCLEASSIKTMI